MATSDQNVRMPILRAWSWSSFKLKGELRSFALLAEPLIRHPICACFDKDGKYPGQLNLAPLIGQRAWELNHRVWTAEAVLRHTLFRQETRWPGYYYRGDYPKLDDAAWHAFTASQYDAKTGEWHMSNLPVHHIIE